MSLSSFSHGPKLVLRGLRVELTGAMTAAFAAKAARLFRHEPDILRLRIDVGVDHHKSGCGFVARGQIDLPGPDLTASTRCDDAVVAVSLLIDKLDRMLRKRATARRRNRHHDDIRIHPVRPEQASAAVS